MVKDMARFCTELAHDLNLRWGKQNDVVVDDRAWDQLIEEEREVKTELFLRFKKYEKKVKKTLSSEDLHTLWLINSPVDHPCNIPFDELSKPAQAKDGIYAFCLRLYDYSDRVGKSKSNEK